MTCCNAVINAAAGDRKPTESGDCRRPITGGQVRRPQGTPDALVFHDLTIFHRHDANDPSPARADWILRELIASGLISSFRVAAAFQDQLRMTFRSDLFHQAARMVPRVVRSAVNV